MAQLADFLGILDKLGLEPTAEEVADLLWLAQRLPASKPVSTETDTGNDKPDTSSASTDTPEAIARGAIANDRRERFETVSSAGTSAKTRKPEAASLYPMQAATNKTTGRAATLFRSAAAYALPAPLEVGRSLRPLNRRIPSRTQQTLDETATAEAIANASAIFGVGSGIWTPVVQPTPERWLSLALVVDESSSMLVWETTISEWITLLERQGAFREMQTWGMSGDNTASPADAALQFYAGIGANGQRDRLRHPAELQDEQPHRLIVVMSDCVSPIWHNGKAAKVLIDWGKQNPILLVQLLPERMWVRTGLRNFADVHLRAEQAGVVNHQLKVFWSEDWLEEDSNDDPSSHDPPRKILPLPVTTLESNWLATWARAFAGNSAIWMPGVVLTNESTGDVPSDQDFTAEELVRNFYATASPLAQRLAIYLACVPLSLPIIRLVQRVMLPEARQVHLAEVLLSGLIVRPTPSTRYAPADTLRFDFVHEVRPLLQKSLRRSEMEKVLIALSTYIGEKSGRQVLDFATLLADPSVQGTGEWLIDEAYQSFAQVTAGVLRRFGNQYEHITKRLEEGSGQTIDSSTAPKVTIAPATHVEQTAQHAYREQIAIYGILVGVNQYRKEVNVKIGGSVNDIQITQAWLQARIGVSSDRLFMLIDQMATKQAVVEAWRNLAKRVQAGDQVYFHFSGLGGKIASTDPNDGDGQEEFFMLCDSIQSEPQTLLTHRELGELVEVIEQRGAQVILFLDTGHTASSYLCQHHSINRVVIAASSETEQCYEIPVNQITYGCATYFMAEAMKESRPGMTWAEVFDSIYVQVKARQNAQTPRLIGANDLFLFRNERKFIPPYLLVTTVKKDQIVEINAHAALGLQQERANVRFAIYPPGSDMKGEPIAYANATKYTQTSISARLDSPVTVPLGSRVRLMPVDVQESVQPSSSVQQTVISQAPDPSTPFYQINQIADRYVIEDNTGAIIWGEDTPLLRMEDAKQVLNHLLHFQRVLTLENQEKGFAFADAIQIEVDTAKPSEETIIDITQPSTLRIRNQSETDLYISLWMLDDHLGVQRVFPPQTDCTLLGKGRTLQIAMTLPMNKKGRQEEERIFKVFATPEPANLDILQQERIQERIEWSVLERLVQSR